MPLCGVNFTVLYVGRLVNGAISLDVKEEIYLLCRENLCFTLKSLPNDFMTRIFVVVVTRPVLKGLETPFR